MKPEQITKALLAMDDVTLITASDIATKVANELYAFMTDPTGDDYAKYTGEALAKLLDLIETKSDTKFTLTGGNEQNKDSNAKVPPDEQIEEEH